MEAIGNVNANSAQATHDEDDPRAYSEVDVTTVSSNDIPPTDADVHLCLGNAGEEFLGSSLSGRSIYAPPRTNRRNSDNNNNSKDIVDELTDAIESIPVVNANGYGELDHDNDDDVNNNNHSDDDDVEGGTMAGMTARSSTSTTSSNEGGGGSNVPEWKRKIIERKREEMREKEREREKWESIPEWRRKLLESKSSKDRQQSQSPTSSSPPPPLAIEGDGAVSGARFWGVTLKKTPGKAKDAEPRDGDAAGAVGEDATTAATGAPGEQDAGGAGSVEGDKEGQDA